MSKLGVELFESYAIFRVWAPFAQEVSLIGDFSKWQPIPMAKDAETGIWEEYLKNDIKLLVDSDCLIDIENESYESKGAMLEKMICMSLGISIISLSSFLEGNMTYKYSTTKIDENFFDNIKIDDFKEFGEMQYDV